MYTTVEFCVMKADAMKTLKIHVQEGFKIWVQRTEFEDYLKKFSEKLLSSYVFILKALIL